MTVRVVHGDCVDVMAGMPPDSVDAVVTDPPYGLEFMGKEWDRLDRHGPASFENPGEASRDETGRRSRDPNATSTRYSDKPRWSTMGQTATRAMQEWHERWACEALRVLKPGGHLLAFGGSRTYHRLACAVEDAGFEIRDMIDTDSGPIYCDGGFLSWRYGSGFPKSLDVSKAIDKAAGAERDGGTQSLAPVTGDDTGIYNEGKGNRLCETCGKWTFASDRCVCSRDGGPATPDAERWQGWGTALKPSHEPIVVARKPLVGTVAENVQRFGTGALNIDGCRIAGTPRATGTVNPHAESGVNGIYGADPRTNRQQTYDANLPSGRWPANVALVHSESCVRVGTRRVKGSAPASGPTLTGASESVARGRFNGVGATPSYADADGMEQVDAWECVQGCPVKALDEQSGTLTSGSRRAGDYELIGGQGRYNAVGRRPMPSIDGSQGGASRFFYTAKASSAERNAMDLSLLPRGRHRARQDMIDRRHPGHAGGWKHRPRNRHPTVKPVAAIRWLVRMTTRPGGLVLDCFGGSGTTGIAADLEGVHAVLVERDMESVITSRARIALWHRHGDQAPDAMPVSVRPPAHPELPPATVREAYLRARRTMTRTPADALADARRQMAAPVRPRNDRSQLALELF